MLAVVQLVEVLADTAGAARRPAAVRESAKNEKVFNTTIIMLFENLLMTITEKLTLSLLQISKHTIINVSLCGRYISAPLVLIIEYNSDGNGIDTTINNKVMMTVIITQQY